MKPATFGPVYCCIYPEIAEIARSHGYALAIHGTLARDFDLICVPWVDLPSDPEAVVSALTSKYRFKQIGEPSLKPHGRLVYTLAFSFGECFMDLGFMPVVRSSDATA